LNFLVEKGSFRRQNLEIMKSVKLQLIIGMIFLATSLAIGQDTEVPGDTTEENTLSQQFNSLKDRSNSYQEYKVIKLTSLNSFWNNVNDSLAAIQKEIIVANNNITSLQQNLDSLKNKLEAREAALEKSEYDIAHLSVLGMDVQKESYVSFTWGVFFVLLLLLAIAIAKYRSSNKVAVEKKSDYEALNNELNDCKQKAREKEIKLMRELQTERNHVEELNQKIVALRKQAH
jgi:DNA repair exonuclease SbcCD ATPase subunit